jgi:predicted Zn-ribbon and HTH transcriptional regulator
MSPIVKIDAFKCSKCGYIWTSNRFTAKNPPIACSKCKSAYWNREPTTKDNKKK